MQFRRALPLILPALASAALGQSFRYPANPPQDLPAEARLISAAWFKALQRDDFKTVARLGTPFLGWSHPAQDGGNDFRFFKGMTHFARFATAPEEDSTHLPDLLAAYACAPEQGEICYQAGHALLKAGRFQEALPPLRDAVRIYPFPDARVDLAVALNGGGRATEALPMLEALDSAFPGLRRIQYERANCLVSLKRFQEAEPILSALIAKDPNDSGAHQELAYVLIELHRPKEALPHLAACARLQPQDPNPWIERVEAHLQLHQIPEAEAACREVARRSPSSRVLAALERRIQSVKNPRP